MLITRDERNRILSMLEHGQVSALEAGQLLDTLESDLPPASDPSRERHRDRTLRIRASHVKAHQQHAYATASVPLSVLRASLRVSGQFLPQLSTGTLADLLKAIEYGASGRLLDVQDLEKGERIEIFVD